MLSNIKSGVIIGIDGRVVNIETCIANGLPNFNIVGLASKSVVESRERIKASIHSVRICVSAWTYNGQLVSGKFEQERQSPGPADCYWRIGKSDGCE